MYIPAVSLSSITSILSESASVNALIALDGALQFDGSHNYLSLGNLGTYGAHLSDGVHLSFDMKTSSTIATCIFGGNKAGSTTALLIFINAIGTGTNVQKRMRIFLRDDSGKLLDCGFTSDVNFIDGIFHAFTIDITPSTNTVVVTMDGVTIPVTNTTSSTPASFSNLTTGFTIGARDNAGTPSTFAAVTLSNFVIGTSLATYASYAMDEKTGTTTVDGSGNGNTATLSESGVGNPLPSWVDGPTNSITGRGVQFGFTQIVDRTVDELGTLVAGAFSESLTSLFPGNVYYVRAYATNSFGTGYSAWSTFTTLADGYSILINGVDRTADVLIQTLRTEDSVNDKTSNCRFSIYDRRSLGLPTTDQEIIITLNSGTRLFAGRILSINKKVVQGTYLAADMVCIDYNRDFDRNLVNTTYQSDTDLFIIQDIVNSYCDGSGITYANVTLGVTIDQIAFNYIQPSKAMRKICDLTGRNWYIDYNKDLHYFPLTQNPAPFNITDSQTFASGQGYYGIQISSDASQLKNRVYVRGGTKLSDATTFSRKGDGTVRKFNLPDKPHDVSVSVNGVAKSLGIKNIDTSGFDYYLNFEEKYLEQDSGATVLSTTDVLAITYTYDIPILVAVENTPSITASGSQEFVIVDQTISTTQAARDRASAELSDYANNVVEGSFKTRTNGFRSGQYVNINSTVLGITNTNYIIQKVQGASVGGGKFEYTIYLASAKTMGVIRFLLEMLENNKNLAKVSSNEVLDNLVTLNDSLDPNSLTEILTIDSAGPYRTWCVDSLEATTTRAIWGLFQWGP